MGGSRYIYFGGGVVVKVKLADSPPLVASIVTASALEFGSPGVVRPWTNSPFGAGAMPSGLPFRVRFTGPKGKPSPFTVKGEPPARMIWEITAWVVGSTTRRIGVKIWATTLPRS